MTSGPFDLLISRTAMMRNQSLKTFGKTLGLNPEWQLPLVFYFSDPRRDPKPEATAISLPPGCAIIYRHFGETGALERAKALLAMAKARDLKLLIGQDADMAKAIGAHGVHLPEAALSTARAWRDQNPDWLITGAIHSQEPLKALSQNALNAVFVSPVFASSSPSAQGKAPIGPLGLKPYITQSPVPVCGLGGINSDTIVHLKDSGLFAIGAHSALVE